MSKRKFSDFSIDAILSKTFMPKRSSNDQNAFSDHLILIDRTTSKNEKFRLLRTCTQFILHALEDVDDPTELLNRACFARSMREALDEAKMHSIRVDKVGCVIRSENLKSPICIPIRKITENTLDSIFNEFDHVAQSYMDGALNGADFTLEYTCLDTRDTDLSLLGSGGPRIVRGEMPENIDHNSLIPVENRDINNYCLFYALELSRLRGVMTSKQFRRLQDNPSEQKIYVYELIAEIPNFPHNLRDYDARYYIPVVQLIYNKRYGEIYKIFLFSDVGYYKPVFKSENSNWTKSICIYLDNNRRHFYGIRTLSSFFKKTRYCLSCEAPYDKAVNHKSNCKARCRNCLGIGQTFPCPSKDARKTCAECGKIFYNDECYTRHLNKPSCTLSKRCDQCGVIYSRKETSRKSNTGHICNTRYCRNCYNYHLPGKKECYIAPLELKDETAHYRLVIFDLETRQDTQLDPAIDSFIHIPNFICAKVLCTRCIESGDWMESMENQSPCEICGTARTLTWSCMDYTETRVDSKDICASPLANFVRWLLYKLPMQYRSIVLSHFGGRYDMGFVFKEIYNLGGINPQIIRQGNRLYEMKVAKKRTIVTTIFHDTYNLMPVKLSELPRCFNLPIADKLYFPHLFNRMSNYGVVLDQLPPKDDYLYKSMTPKNKEKFERWYEEHMSGSFALNEKLAEYCCNDVEILTYASIEMRRIFADITQLDILESSITLPSACMRYFRTSHLKKGHLAICPELGYETHDRQSALALRYLDWYARVNECEVQTSITPGGEYHLKYGNEGKFLRLDGLVLRDDGPPLALEINGCVWHGCPNCFPNDDILMPNGKTASKLRAELEDRNDIINRDGIELKSIWECEIQKQLKHNIEMRKCFDAFTSIPSINLRSDAFFGGRTQNMRIYYEVEPGFRISYKDFNSLYSFTNFRTCYPVGHPKVKSFNTTRVHWTCSGDNPYEGILKVRVIPPKNLLIPPLPAKFDQRLLFPLCYACAKLYPTGGYIADYYCEHNEEQRSFTVTSTHMELNLALDEGYQVVDLYTAYVFDKWDDSLFADYVAQFMKLKIEASGWPGGIETSEDRALFIRENKELFNIDIDADAICDNPAIRTVSKFCLNSLWGRFSMRCKLTKTTVTDSPAKMRQLLDDPRLNVNSIDVLNRETIMLSHCERDEFIEENASANVIISLWTTSAARVILYGALKKVMACPGAGILYMDTDSIIYKYPAESIKDPLPHGVHLGELKDEKPHHEILEFVSGGCKQYALKLRNKKSNVIEYDLKIRGITLDHNTCSRLNFDSFKEMVLLYGRGGKRNSYASDSILLNYRRFGPNRLGEIYTKDASKKYQVVIQKGIVNRYGIVLPYGYCHE